MSNVPISTRLTVPAGELQPVVEETLALIDSLHTIPDLPVIPVVTTSTLTPFARYVPGDGRPERIELSRLGPHKRLSLAHEIGHLLDHALGYFDVYCSNVEGSALAEIMEVIEDSEAVRILKNAMRGNI